MTGMPKVEYQETMYPSFISDDPKNWKHRMCIVSRSRKQISLLPHPLHIYIHIIPRLPRAFSSFYLHFLSTPYFNPPSRQVLIIPRRTKSSANQSASTNSRASPVCASALPINDLSRRSRNSRACSRRSRAAQTRSRRRFDDMKMW